MIGPPILGILGKYEQIPGISCEFVRNSNVFLNCREVFLCFPQVFVYFPLVLNGHEGGKGQFSKTSCFIVLPFKNVEKPLVIQANLDKS